MFIWLCGHKTLTPRRLIRAFYAFQSIFPKDWYNPIVVLSITYQKPVTADLQRPNCVAGGHFLHSKSHLPSWQLFLCVLYCIWSNNTVKPEMAVRVRPLKVRCSGLLVSDWQDDNRIVPILGEDALKCVEWLGSVSLVSRFYDRIIK